MKPIKKTCTTLSILLLSTWSYAGTNLAAETSKEIWLKFRGIDDCQIGQCADGIPSRPLKLALDYYEENKNVIENDRYVGIVDFSKSSKEKRFWILDLNSGSSFSMHVTHGKNSEGRLSYADKFSNVVGSEMSSLGFYVTDTGTYFGKHGESLRLKGLSKTNSKAWERAIVIHAADYAGEWIIEAKGRLGLSQGCPAVSKANIQKVLARMKGRTLFLTYHPQLEESLQR